MKSKKSKSSLPPLLKEICQTLDEKKAGDLKVLSVSAQSSITDYLVLGTGTSEPHLRALRVELEKVIDRAGVRIIGMDTDQGSGWLVVDAFDIMVHIFTAENRKKYALENLWKDAEDLPLSTVLAVEKKAAIKPARKSAPKVAKKATATPPKRKTGRSK
ncbi:MAG: ribosome silencing factor [Nibricoccus sp.]